MTFSEAFTEIEAALEALDIRDKWGDPCEGALCYGFLEKYSGGKWGELLERATSMSADAFCAEGLALVALVGRVKFWNGVEQDLAGILEKQNQNTPTAQEMPR